MREDRKRQLKNNLNPRGMTWVNDESKKCQKMMEKFGWEKGKGLGRKEDGIKENIRANGNAGKKGFGSTPQSRDTVLFVQDEYSSILAGLNEMYGGKEEDKNKQTTFVDLEENCKKSTSRVYYSRFVQGKNLANKSQKDLDCILGRNRKKVELKEEEPIEEEEETKEPQIDDQSQKSNAELLQTQTVNMYAYFAEKMAALKKAAASRKNSDDQSQKSDENNTTNVDEVSNATTYDEDTQTTATTETTESQNDEAELPKPKKSKKRKHLSDSEDVANAEVPADETKKKKTHEIEVEEEEEAIKPKKKRRKLEKDEEVDDNIPVENDDQKPSKKSKKSKKKHSEVEVKEAPIVEEDEKIKRCSEVESVAAETEEASASEEVKKKKKKKKAKGE